MNCHEDDNDSVTLVIAGLLAIVLIVGLALYAFKVYPFMAEGTSVYMPNEGEIQWNYEECQGAFIGFFHDYSNYHYEGEGITIDYAIDDFRAEEDAAQFCDYFFNRT